MESLLEGDTGSLSVTALEDGTIVNYYLNSAETSSDSQDMPTFPQGDPQQAKAAAQAFLDKVLVTNVESVVLEESEDLSSLDSDTFHFNGTVLLNGLPSPLSYSLTVRASDNQVTRFWRDVPETTFLGVSPVQRPTNPRPTLQRRSRAPYLCGWSTFF